MRIGGANLAIRLPAICSSVFFIATDSSYEVALRLFWQKTMDTMHHLIEGVFEQSLAALDIYCFQANYFTQPISCIITANIKSSLFQTVITYHSIVKGIKAIITLTESAPVTFESAIPRPVPIREAAMDWVVIFAVMSPRLFPPCGVKLRALMTRFWRRRIHWSLIKGVLSENK